MISCLARFLSISFILLCWQSFAVEPVTLELSKKMIALIQEAKDCGIEKEANGVTLCTGIRLTKKDISFFKGLNLKSCQKFIRQLGYHVYANSNKGKATLARTKKDKSFKQMRDEFNGSTKLAFIDYGMKTVLFKPSAKVGDCIHEIVHFYQHNRESSAALAPANREKLQEQLQKQLEKEVDVVASWEKKGNKEMAQELAHQLGPLIQLQKEWIKLTNWLDEKEVYEFMFDYYKIMGLQERDLDIAVSNLVRLKYALDWRWREKALYTANQLLNHKYERVKASTKNFKSEKKYNDQYVAGKISRDEFEQKVIAQRKGVALRDYKSATKLKDQLTALTRGRFYSKELKLLFEAKKFNYKVKEDLPYVDLELALTNGKKIRLPMLIDLGAQQSIIPLSFIEHGVSQCPLPGKNGKMLLIGEKKIKNGHTGTEKVPLVQINFPLELGGEKLEHMTFALSSAPFFLKFGILGIDFFRKSKSIWSWDFKNKVIGKIQKFDSDAHLMANGVGLYDALEFTCPYDQNIQIRMDTGSQVYGDYRKGLKPIDLEKCIQGVDKLSTLPSQQIYFSRGVDVNLGFQYLNQYYSLLNFDLDKGAIEYEGLKP